MDPKQEEPQFRIEMVEPGLVRVSVVDYKGSLIRSFLLRVVPNSDKDDRPKSVALHAPA